MDQKHFTVTQQHIDLLQHAFVSWENCEFGAPAIDCKRPYGNSDVYNDIAEILDIKPDGDEDSYYAGFSNEQTAYMERVHRETQTALQIFLVTGKMEAGTYVSDRYLDNWKREED